MKGFPNPWLELQAFSFGRAPYQPTRPGIYKRVEKTGPRQFREVLVDNTTYPGVVLRDIRRGGNLYGHSDARECARRLARGCCQ